MAKSYTALRKDFNKSTRIHSKIRFQNKRTPSFFIISINRFCKAFSGELENRRTFLVLGNKSI